MHPKNILHVVATFACAVSLWHAPAVVAAETAGAAGISLERLQRLDRLLDD